MSNELQQAAKALREFALGLPGAYVEHPWGESVAKVNRKVFVFMGKASSPIAELAFSVKLPESRHEALEFSWAEPTGYGLGKSGWVSVRFQQGEPPVDLFRCWIEESYRTIAPVKLVAKLDNPGPEPKSKPARQKPITQKENQMIKGVHTMYYSSQADELRAFLRDKLDLHATDVGDGWLIFDLPEAEMGCHPADPEKGAVTGTHDISFYCDDVEKTVADLKAKGVEFSDGIADHGYGLVTRFRVPGDFTVQLYQPRYVKEPPPKTKAKKPPTKKTVKKVVKKEVKKAMKKAVKKAKR